MTTPIALSSSFMLFSLCRCTLSSHANLGLMHVYGTPFNKTESVGGSNSAAILVMVANIFEARIMSAE